MDWNRKKLPKSFVPMSLLPRYNVVINSFQREQFAILSGFEPGLGLEASLDRQVLLVEKIRSAGLGWFPVFWDWGDAVRRSLFVHRPTVAEAELRRKQTPGAAEASIPDPTFELVLSLRRQAGVDRFIWGEKGQYLVYQGEPPLPTGTGGEFKLSVDLDFIVYCEKQGLLVTQNPKARKKP